MAQDKRRALAGRGGPQPATVLGEDAVISYRQRRDPFDPFNPFGLLASGSALPRTGARSSDPVTQHMKREGSGALSG
jgi:hypothetical protein